MPAGKVSVVWKFLKDIPGYTMTKFKEEWNLLTDNDKEELTAGIESGNLTY